jgi:formamidopyrimidine-DNA glycosylase
MRCGWHPARPRGGLQGVPELPEVEFYRRAAACVVGRTIQRVSAPDDWWARGAGGSSAVRRNLRGRSVLGARRHGKLLLLELSSTPDGLDEGLVLGMRFGMTGLLEVDGARPIGELLYSSPRRERSWQRLRLAFEQGELLVVDPRRLGGVEFDPDPSRLGPDATDLSTDALRTALAGAGTPVKACLLDQRRIAGIGNLLADEALWRAGVSPAELGGSLDAAALRRLARAVRSSIGDALVRGGSHTGDLMSARRPGGTCPRDGAPLVRSTIAGRTSWWCPQHQRAGAA